MKGSEYAAINNSFIEIVFDFYTSEILTGKREKRKEGKKNVCMCIYTYIFKSGF